MKSIRQNIVEIAKGEAVPSPFGKVSDSKTDENGNRAGWQVLKDYFEKACKWNDSHWKGRGKIKVGGAGDWIDIGFLDGIKKPKYRIPQGGNKPSGISWCGIFATWCLIKAGLDVQWINGQGIVGERVTRIGGNRGFKEGDIVVIQGGEVHHAIVSELYEEANYMQTVNGNSSFDQRIEIHSQYSPERVWYYYKISD